ncbi:MAG: acyl carrier protein [Lachnospiraceae bacterium]|nr:acyl carrier protein [Lachnospiraceae bacterium]
MNFEKVKEIIVETANLNEADVKPESKLKDDLGLDSLDAMELNMALEEKFDLTISDEELINFITVQDIVKYIDEAK